MPKKILIVEDEVMLLETMKTRLEFSGYEVVIAENGKDGAFKAISEKPDIILADLMMPELSGFDMIKIIRSNSDLKEVPIIAVSALGRDEDMKKAKEVGANEYVVKPYNSADLLKKIEDLTK
ncbi:MAG: response regulator transcription factor [Deltaproteobacteria bacterium]|mgnify:CR=1 FL=1|jgi:DNA-binding response OmpR family regulator|nr:response regulator transcription factor [Deltaproteobacteria bacterium]